MILIKFYQRILLYNSLKYFYRKNHVIFMQSENGIGKCLKHLMVSRDHNSQKWNFVYQYHITIKYHKSGLNCWNLAIFFIRVATVMEFEL